MKFINREVEYPNRIELIKVEGKENVFDIKRAEGNIIEPGTPLSAEKLNTLAPKADPNFAGVIKSGNREIGHTVFGYGQIAKQFSHTVINNATRFTAYITATFLGNRRWRISGCGYSVGNGWDSGFVINGIGYSNLGLILFNDADFFSSTGQINNGKFIKVLTTTAVDFTGSTNNTMGLGASFGLKPDRAVMGRDYSNNGILGEWDNTHAFGGPAYIDFEFMLLAAKD